jgi:DNA-binding LytR/AlgR family response regulator
MSPHRFLSLSLSLALAGGVANASAQEADASYYDGTWTARLPCKNGAACPARLVLSDFAGTWQDLSGTSMSKRLCGGKKMPVTVQSSTRSQLAFTAFGDGVSAGCQTLSILVKPVNEKILAGTFEMDTHPSESPEVHASHSAPSATGKPADDEAGKATARSARSSRTIRLQRR